jgi:hypothetical protein
MGKACSEHGEKRNAYMIWWESENETDLDVVERITLK